MYRQSKMAAFKVAGSVVTGLVIALCIAGCSGGGSSGGGGGGGNPAPPANEAPVADVLLNGQNVDDINGLAPFQVNFDLSVSTDTDGVIQSATIDFGDGSGVVNLQGNNLETSRTYNVGQFVVEIAVVDDDGASDTINVVVRVDAPPPQDPLTVNGVAEVGEPVANNQKFADVFTHSFGQMVSVRGLNLNKLDPDQLKVRLTNDLDAQDVHDCSVVVINGVEVVALLPRLNGPGTYNVSAFYHEVGDSTDIIEQAVVSNPPPQVDYLFINKTTMVHSGEDTGANDGSLVAYDVDGLGQLSNIRELLAGNGHKWRAGGILTREADTVFALGFAGFTMQLFMLDVNGGAPIVLDVDTNPVTLQSPVAVTIDHVGKPMVLSQEPNQTYHVFHIADDNSAVEAHIKLDGVGNGPDPLPAGTPIAGFGAVRMQKPGDATADFGVIAAGGLVRKLFLVRFDTNTYETIDLDRGDGFSPEAMSLIHDPFSGGYRIDLAGVSTSGNGGTDFRTIVLRSGDLPFVGNIVTATTSDKSVVGVQTFFDEANDRHIVWVARQGENFYSGHDVSNGFQVAFNRSHGIGSNNRDMVRASGLGGFLIGFSGQGGAGVVLVPGDGLAETRLDLGSTGFGNIAAGSHVFAVDTTDPEHATMFHHTPTGVTSNLEPLGLGRNGLVINHPGKGTP